ncbi:MAG: alpha-amylase family glycosyl hydrolase [Ignavibacteriaceae bacterium]|nr:alpha-amylase family glycosyl hydrolase [Ignavibacteriaceae bacterium]
MRNNPKLYEINTRVWLKKIGKKLSDLPFTFFSDLAQKGINIVWLMGLWKTSPNIVSKYCFTPDLINSYDKALKGWKKEDVIGSPYAIDEYDVNPEIGTWGDLVELRKRLNNIGIKLILDFVPNHFSIDSSILEANPDIFLQVDEELLQKDPFTFFRSQYNPGTILAHGRDPLFPAWQDTVQVNYFSINAREYLCNILLKLVEVCDGLRCDMAMLPLNNVFYNTWMGVLNKSNLKRPSNEFWDIAIKKVKEKNNDFIFLAEAYWDLEWDLQQLGFNYTYDKRLTDRLVSGYLPDVIAHLKADKDFQNKSVRFIENHDEPRAVSKFGKFRSLAAATVIGTIQGMKFYYDGQFDGKKIRLPVQLGREPEEKISNTVNRYYEKLLNITKQDIFILGNWELLEPITAGNGNLSYQNFLAWQWSYKTERTLVIINYSEITSQCRIKIDSVSNRAIFNMFDLLNGKDFDRLVSEIKSPGLFIELKGYASHILTFSES